MASNINPNSIDATFPVPGQDNDTQGFRDNFSAIVTALTTANFEISQLQMNGASLVQNNDFNTNEIRNAILHDVGWLVADYTGQAVTGFNTINYQAGNYQKFLVDPTTTTNFTIINWPANNINGTLQVQVQSTNTQGMVYFQAVTTGTTLYVDSRISNPYTVNSQTAVIFEISSPDQGNTQFLTAYSVGTSTTTGAITFSDITVTDTANSTSTTTGALVVNGGVGIAADVVVGGTVTANSGSYTTFNVGGYGVSTATVINTVLNSSTYIVGDGSWNQNITFPVDYGLGSYQRYTVNNTQTSVGFYFTNWPQDGGVHKGTLEIQYTQRTRVAFQQTGIYISTCTTNGLSVDVYLGSGTALNQFKIGSGWYAWTDTTPSSSLGQWDPTNPATYTTLTTVQSVIGSQIITVNPPINLSTATTLYFAPGPGAAGRVGYVSNGATLVVNRQYPSNYAVGNTGTTIVLEVTTPDGGNTIFVDRVDAYDAGFADINSAN
jgi:hypothetical protein